MIALHHYTPVERAMIRHQLRDPREMYPAVRVRCYTRGLIDHHATCIVTTANNVTTYYRYSRNMHGVYTFRMIGAVA